MMRGRGSWVLETTNLCTDPSLEEGQVSVQPWVENHNQDFMIVKSKMKKVVQMQLVGATVLALTDSW